jgi:hypothetical protein
MMYRIRLIVWNDKDLADRAALLAAAGYDVTAGLTPGPHMLRPLQADPPDAVVIDLGRLPSQGRDVGVNLRISKPTRRIPLVFAGGDPGKTARIRDLLPDAVYTTWEEIGSALPQAIAHPPQNPVVPESSFAGYSGTPLPAKLGIKPGATVALAGAPPDFAATLGSLPPGVTLCDAPAAGCQPILWFVTSQRAVNDGFAQMAGYVQNNSLWVIWPKKAAGSSSDVTQQAVRDAGLAIGLVDYKIAAIDATWTGLCFTRRKSKA